MTSPTAVLSAYALPGRAVDPRAGITQAIAAERIGLGRIWASERWDTKETGVLCGALAQATSRIEIVAGLTHFSGRHPLVAAGMGSTMQALSGGRFVMGVGRSVPALLRSWGFPVFNSAHLRDYVGLLRRLWAGERVSYEGILGSFPNLQLMQPPETAPPVILGAVGPKTLALGGEAFDGVVLHPFLTAEAVTRSANIIREAAASAGRDPASVKVTACVVTAPDTLTPAETASVLHARAVSYFRHQVLARPIVEINGWDMSGADALVQSGLDHADQQGGGAEALHQRLAAAAGMLPPEWLTSGAAVGTTEDCAARLHDYRKAGADEILIHGTTPDRLDAIVQAYAAMA